MWGSGVTRENSILGFLEQKLDPKGSYEIVNAAVVGYSTYQELLNLQQNILPLKPSIVLVNFCENDLLPTEDPFKNARQIHVQYLNHLLEDRNLKFTRFIFKRKNAGKGAALRTGIEEARGDIVLTRTRIWSTTHGNIPDSSNPLLRDTPMSCMAHDFYPGRIESYFSGIR